MIPDQLIQVTVLPPVMSQLQYATLIGETIDTVRGWVESRTLPVIKIGKKNHINIKRLSDDIAAGKTVFSRGDYCD